MVQTAGKHWYVVHTQTGHEERVKVTLESRTQQWVRYTEQIAANVVGRHSSQLLHWRQR